MTTAVTVNAHAGWDVEVELLILDAEKKVTDTRVQVVPKNTEQTFYIHSHMMLGRVKELEGA